MKNKIIVSVILYAIACMAGIVVNAHADQIVTGANISVEARAKIEPMKPNSTFETQNLSPAPNYQFADTWAALPDKADNADLAPANTKYPESQALAAADVFFIHPTTAVTARDN